MEALLEILAKQRRPDQTVSEWRTVTESRLESTSLILKNYSGDNLKIVRIIMSRPGYSISAMVQVQSGAPAKLLVGADLLSQLGYFFVQASEDDHDLDMLASGSESILECQSIQQQNESNKERCDDIHTIESNVEDNIIQNKLASKKDTISEKGSTTCATGIVCLVQATRIPARHKKIVRVKMSDNNYCHEGILTMFELDGVMKTQQLMAPSALVCLDHLKEFTLVLENHGCEPIYLQTSQTVGHIENVLVCLPEEVQETHYLQR